MNVASLELCKELYELSGWNDKKGLLQEIHHYTEGIVNTAYAVTRYDLGYLLRKLPTTEIYHGRTVRGDYKAEWRFYGGDNRTVRFWADTPEDAAAKLAIELFKQGILSKDQGEQA